MTASLSLYARGSTLLAQTTEASAARAAQVQKNPNSQRCPVQVYEVIDITSVLPSSLAADALIRTASKISRYCLAVAQQLLRRAFEQADSVAPETSFTVGLGYSTDSRIAFTENSYSLQMDKLSLQSRAVLQMGLLKASEAIRLFQIITPPRPSVSGCSNAFVADVSIYYKALGRALELLRADKHRNAAKFQLPYSLLEQTVAATTSPTQLWPLAKVMAEANLSNVELSSLLNLLAARITNFPTDDRALNAGNYGGSYWDGLVALSDLAWKHNISRVGLVQAFRDYLDRSLRGPHCAGHLETAAALAQTCQSLNRDLAILAPEVSPISVPESTPPIEPKPDTGEYWQSAKGKLLLLDAKHLNFDDSWNPYSEADRNRPEWQGRVQHLLDDMEEWNESDEQDSASYYHERCILLWRLLDRLPAGPLYDRVLMLWVKTFEESSLQWDSPPEWYYGIKQFLDSANPRKQLARFSALNKSSNPNLHALGVVEQFLRRGQELKNTSDPSSM
jgi:hypothetical protein